MKFFFGFILLISVAGCNTSKPAKIQPIENKSASINGEWELQMLFASDNKWKEAPYIKLDFASKTFAGNTGCNSITGSFTVNESSFSFDKPATTKKACPGYNENIFISALSKINHYTILNDQLEFGQGEIVLMKFKRK